MPTSGSRPRGKEVRLRPKARADIEAIWLYTAEHWSLKQADIYHGRIVEILTALASVSCVGAQPNMSGPAISSIRPCPM